MFQPAGKATTDHEAELWVLQSMILDDNAADYVITNANEQDFDDPRNQLVFRYVCKQQESGRKLDKVLFIKDMQEHSTVQADKSDLEAIGGMAYLGKIIADGVTSSNVKYYLQRLRRATTFRRLHFAAMEIGGIIETADSEEPIEEIASRCEQLIFDATERNLKRDSLVHIKAATMDALDRLDFRTKHGAGEGLQSGFRELDKMTGGFRPGEMVIIAARPGCGKSALASNIAESLAIGDGDGMVLLVSLEMSSLELVDRMLSSYARVPLYAMRNGTLSASDRSKVVERSSSLASARLYLEDAATRTIAQIASTARMVKRKHGLNCIILDYVQLVHPDNAKDPRQEQVAKISRKLKAMAREMKVPILCLAQLNRQADDPTKPPRLSQLRESGALEQDADVVIFIHRPGTVLQGDSEEAELHVAKQRNGPTGVAKVHWFRHWCRFDNAAENWQERREPAFDKWNGSPEEGF